MRQTRYREDQQFRNVVLEEFVMKFEFQVQAKIQKSLQEVFDAVYDPNQLSGYFTTAGAPTLAIDNRQGNRGKW